MKTFTDKEIVQGLQQKNTRLIDGITKFLYDQCQKDITRMVCQNSGDDDDANDLFQEVILDFLHNVWNGKFQLGDAKIRAYIGKIARLKWLAELRRRKSETKKQDKYNQVQPKEPELYDDDEEELDEETIVRAFRVFDRLETRCKALLTAFYREGKSLQQIANELGYNSAEYAKTAKNRCLQKLKILVHQS